MSLCSSDSRALRLGRSGRGCNSYHRDHFKASLLSLQNLEKEYLESILDGEIYLSEITRKLGIPNPKGWAGNAKAVKMFQAVGVDVREVLKENAKKRFYLTKECLQCKKLFTIKRCNRDKHTCSYACSNTYFRSGKDNPRWKGNRYRNVCFLYHEKKCIICGEFNAVEVHHLDENSKNNDPRNLMPLCPTHHQYWHSRYKPLIQEKVLEYAALFSERYEEHFLVHGEKSAIIDLT